MNATIFWSITEMPIMLVMLFDSLKQGGAAKGSLSKEDAAFICVEALDVVPQVGYIFEVRET